MAQRPASTQYHQGMECWLALRLIDILTVSLGRTMWDWVCTSSALRLSSKHTSALNNNLRLEATAN